jgi:hypothetical protein
MKKSRTTTESTESPETDEKARVRIRKPLPFFSGLCALCVSVVNPEGGPS